MLPGCNAADAHADREKIFPFKNTVGRVKDNRWYDYGSSTDVDRIKYGYDRASNRVWRQNVVADSLSKPFDELYGYDGVYRLKEISRGVLNSNKDAITNESFAQCWSLDDTGNWKKFLEDSNGNGTWDLNQAHTANFSTRSRISQRRLALRGRRLFTTEQAT